MEPVISKRYKFTCAPSEDSDQPAHPRSLIRIFNGSYIGSQESKVSSGAKVRLWADCSDVQTGLKLRCTHIPTYTYLLANLKEDKIGFQDRLSLNAGLNLCSILQYLRSSLSYHLSLISLFCLFFSGRLRQVLQNDLTHVRYILYHWLLGPSYWHVT